MLSNILIEEYVMWYACLCAYEYALYIYIYTQDVPKLWDSFLPILYDSTKFRVEFSSAKILINMKSKLNIFII